MEKDIADTITERLTNSVEKLINQQEKFEKVLEIVQNHIIKKLPKSDLPITTELEYVNQIIAQYTESLLLLVKVKELINARKSE